MPTDKMKFIFRRGCYLKNEKPLKFFKIYTKNNCRSECLANKTLEVCGCAQKVPAIMKSAKCPPHRIGLIRMRSHRL